MKGDKIRIFDYCWHIPHQWDMVNALKEDCEFFYCMNAFAKEWGAAKRPVPENVNFVTHYEEGKYDVVILHMDQGVMWGGSLKTLIYKQFNSVITDVPKIVLNHGTPVLPEFFEEDMTEEEMQRECIREIKSLVGDNIMVVNSHDSASGREWGFGHPIVHGMDPAEWYGLDKEPRAFTSLSPYGFDKYYNRECMGEAAEILYDKYGYHLLYAKLNISFDSVEEYERFLGKSLLYIDTSVRAPMNRARTEAILSGCCVIQVEGAHDLDRWAVPGENIIIVPDDPGRIADVIADMLENRYEEAVRIGRNAKRTAMELFNRERYRRDWLELLNRIM